MASVEPETPKEGVEDRDAEGIEGVGNWARVSPPQPIRKSGERRKLPQRGPR